MSTRPSRSSSIPIPRSPATTSSARNIESLIPIPFVPPARHQPASPSSSRPIPELRRVSVQDGSRPAVTSVHGVSTSPTRSSARSSPFVSSVPGRSRFEPRVVRNAAPTDSGDPYCPPSTSAPPTHVRRTSIASLRTAASQRPIVPHHVVARTAPVSFPRPSYLDYSALRHLLHTEIPPSHIPTRRTDPFLSSTNQAYANALSTPSNHDDESSSINGFASLPPQDYSFKLPTRWSDQDRHPSLAVSPDGRELTLHGASFGGEKDGASARTIHAVPPACGIFYYEVDILGKDQKCRISIGFSSKTARFAKLPGHEPRSWAFYGDDGSALSPDRMNTQFSQPFGTGDTIGCGIDFTNHKTFFTKNGTLIGYVFDNVGRHEQVYPSVGFQHTGDSARTNFGQEPFKFDIDSHVQQQQSDIWNKILGTSVSRKILGAQLTGVDSSTSGDMCEKPPLSDEELRHLLNELIMSYLVHHGHVKTARTFQSQCKIRDKLEKSEQAQVDECDDSDMSYATTKGNVMESDIEIRTSIVNLVLAGNIDEAIDSLRDHHPTVLEVDKQLMFFKLRLRKFVELILVTTELKKKMKAMKERETPRWKVESPQDLWMADEMGMDIDEDSSPMVIPTSTTKLFTSRYGHDQPSDPVLNELNIQYEDALNAAITYGQALSNDYHSDARPELQQLFQKTFGIVAWEDPSEEGSGMADIVGQQSRIALAHEINQAILKSQGRPAHPPLETLYRHATLCVNQLGVLGEGTAAFADISREILQ